MLRFPAHFTETEVRDASEGQLPPSKYEANAQRVLDWLEMARVYLGRPIVLTSFGRSLGHNAEIAGAASNSQHLYWLGVDFNVAGMTNHEAAAALVAAQAAGALPAYHQIITYEADNHVHVGLAGMQWVADLQNLLKRKTGEYVALTTAALSNLATTAKANPRSTALVLLVALSAFFFPGIATPIA